MPVDEEAPKHSIEIPAEVTEELPILSVRDTVLFPHAMMPITVGRPSSIALVESLGENRLMGVVAQLDPRVDSPGPADLHEIGAIAFVHKVLKVPRDNLLLFCEGVARMRTRGFTATEPFMKARIERIPEIEPPSAPELDAVRDNVLSLFQQIVASSPNLSDDVANIASEIPEPGKLADFIAGALPSLSPIERQKLLEEFDARTRLNDIHKHLTRESELLELRGRIQSQVKGQLSQNQREFYLREQLKAIQKELGEGDDSQRDIQELRAKVEAAGMSEEVQKEAIKELDRLARISPMSPEYGVTRTYLEWMVSLPWNISSGAAVNVKHAAEILDEDHYDLEKVKDRILDYLSVLQLRPVLKGPILCFVGPPGVGKTSLGRSIARAVGRKFARISMGGMHDEAEIRGHRRTYIGALPGQIMQGLRRAGTNDSVFMLDEVDKLGRDFRGDPASALLEVLDPEQNNTFRDNYLDAPFDLSKVLFICTANVLDPIPEPLRDRMEIIELQGYTEEEKVHIAFRYLIPRQIDENGITAEQIEFPEQGVRYVIRHYTREAGVRSLERTIGTICRKQARVLAEGKTDKLVVTKEVIQEFLGGIKIRSEGEIAERTERPGVAVGLAWTPSGGDVLFVEANAMKGKGGFTMTGQIGQVMQESMQAALTWVRSNAAQLVIAENFVADHDIHMHVPAGAIPKDGPSAGVTMATTLVSLLTGHRIRPLLAMTGEITLSGNVLPVGGIKEKVLAAKRAGVTDVILPAENKMNVDEDLTKEQLENLKVHYVKTIDEALRVSLPEVAESAAAKLLATPPPAVHDKAFARA